MFEQLEKTQKIVMQTLKNSFKTNKYNHAYLIIGEETDISLELSKHICTSLLCESNPACNECFDCKNAINLMHNNIYIIDEDKHIKKDIIKELQLEFSKKSFSNKPKIFIMKNADNMNDYAANSLLKFIEEPNPNEVGILIAKNESKILPTIISRCQVLKLAPKINSSLVSELSETYKRSQLNIEILLSFIKDKDFLIDMLKNDTDIVLFKQINTFIESIYHKDKFSYVEASKLAKNIDNPKMFIAIITELFRRSTIKATNLDVMEYFNNIPTYKLIQILDVLFDMHKRLEFNVNFALQFERLAILLNKNL